MKPEARTALGMMRAAAEHGLDPSQYALSEIEAAILKGHSEDQAARIRADILLSQSFARFAQDLHRPRLASSVFYVDSALRPKEPARQKVLHALAIAPYMAEQLADMERLNPFYDDLRATLAEELKQRASLRELQILRLNLDRSRALPVRQTGRYVVVDAASAQLWMVEHGRVADTMRVIVGKANQPTPMMAGLLRFAVLNPYWHIPPDLVPTRVAARVLKSGPGVVERDRLEIVSDWGPTGRKIDAAEVNWPAVAAGRERLRVRQLHGGSNMMGSIKFMMPNRLGIYLHDTPAKALFARVDRRLSSGCVRVEDAARLAHWLFGGRPPLASGAPEERAYLPEPVPVYITYLTAAPGPGGRAVFRPDVYGRDPLEAAARARPALTRQSQDGSAAVTLFR